MTDRETNLRRVVRVVGGRAAEADDSVAVEAPLEIRVAHGPRSRRESFTLTVTLRTPGDDADLVAGFLLAEGLIHDADQLEGVVPCGPGGDVVRAELAPGVAIDPERFRRLGLATGACGACGKPSLESLHPRSHFPLTLGHPRIPAGLIPDWVERIRSAQPGFAASGGLHAAAILDADGERLAIREDIGRHNAVDKVIGALVRAGRVPLTDTILVVSGRAGFELVQKAVMAGVPVLAAVGALSTLAIDTAAAAGLTLLGFVRDGRFNVYSGLGRISF